MGQYCPIGTIALFEAQNKKGRFFIYDFYI